MLLMAGTAVTAFVVAPLSLRRGPPPHHHRIPRKRCRCQTCLQQLAQLDEQSFALYRSEVARQSDTVDSLLRRLGVDDAAAAQFCA